MKNLIILLILCLVAWTSYRHLTAPPASAAPELVATGAQSHLTATRMPAAPAPAFTCDGRTHCSQMRSCAEAAYFVKHCPNTKMDGNGDGVPCEKQWCR